jgi:hypothetical protein
MAPLPKGNKETLLENAKKLNTKDLEVPEWGIMVTIKELMGSERDRFESSTVKLDAKTGNLVPNLVNARARLVAMCLVDDNGNRMFTDSESDILQLGSMSAKGLDKVYEACQELSGLSDADVEEAVANFEVAPTESSTTD